MKTSYQINQLRDYSTLFSRSEVKRWLKNDFSSIDTKVARHDEKLINKNITYIQYLRRIYKILEKNYPYEYIVKNEFLNQWLKQELGSSKSLILNEFRVGKAIADLAMFNGSSKAFEIKTILDKEYRLSTQLEEYSKIFNEVYLIIPRVHLDKYMCYDDKVGIISHDLENNTFKLERKATHRISIDYNTAMEILHTKEYKMIVQHHYGELPPMTDFTQFEVCKKLIEAIPREKLDSFFIKTIKKRSIHNLFFNKINSEFNQICLSLNLSKLEKEALTIKLKNTIKQ